MTTATTTVETMTVENGDIRPMRRGSPKDGTGQDQTETGRIGTGLTAMGDQAGDQAAAGTASSPPDAAEAKPGDGPWPLSVGAQGDAQDFMPLHVSPLRR